MTNLELIELIFISGSIMVGLGAIWCQVMYPEGKK